MWANFTDRKAIQATQNLCGTMKQMQHDKPLILSPFLPMWASAPMSCITSAKQ